MDLHGQLDVVSGVRAIKESDSIEAVAAQLARLLDPLGLTASASGMLTGPRGLSANPVHFRNWDPAWLALYEQQGFLSVDPLIRYPMISGEPASWSDIYARFPPRDPGHRILKEAERFGYREGYVTPVRTRDGSLGLVSAGGPRRTGFRIEERLFIEAVCAASLRRAEELLDEAVPIALPVPLSLRERECVGIARSSITAISGSRRSASWRSCARPRRTAQTRPASGRRCSSRR